MVESRRRVAEIIAGSPDGFVFGSGYLITPVHVLTAAHVLTTNEIVVRLLGDDRLFTGRIVWSRDDESVDAAVIEIVDPRWNPPALPSMRWGRLTGRRGGVRCAAIGFPDAQRDTDRRDTEHLEGTINPGTRAKARRHDVLVDNAPDSAPDGGSSGWGGTSGAAVFCGELLTGVLVSDPAAFASRRLTAVPVEAFAREADFATFVGEVNVESVELTDLFDVPVRRHVGRSPALLLHAEAEVVPFRGRSDLLDELATWSRTPDTVSARLITGLGGQGKTRLAREFAARLRSAGWVTGWLTRPVPGQDAADRWDRLADTDIPTLVVVDYPETRTEQLRQLIDHIGGSPRPDLRLRLLLLARSDGEWWWQLTGATQTVELVLAGTEVGHLPPLDESVAERMAGFRTAAEHFAVALRGHADGTDEPVDWPAVAATLVPPPDLAHPRYESVLAVHTAALVALLQAGPAPVPAGADVEDTLLRHEQRYWRDTAHARGLDALRDATLSLAVAVVTLVGVATETDAVTLLGTLPGLRDQPEDRRFAVAEWLHDLYPSTDNDYWGALRPDRVGEHHVGRVTRDRPDAFDDLVERLDSWQDRDFLIVLSRASARHPHLDDLIARLVRTRPEPLALAAIGAVPRTERPTPLVNALRPLPDTLATQPDLLAKLAVVAGEAPALHDWARKTAAVITTEYRRLAADDPVTYGSKLAKAVDSEAQLLSKLGDSMAAFRAAKEAVTRWRAIDESPEQLRGLATALDVLAFILLTNNQAKKALPHFQEAVDTFDRLIAEDSGTDEDIRLLAQSVNHLSSALNELGEREESLRVARRSLVLFETFTRNDPFDVLAYTDARINVSNRLMDRGDADSVAEAMAGYHEVVERRRELAEAHAIFDGDLASALHNLAKAFGRTGSLAEAIEPIDEAVTIYQRLAARQPEKYMERLYAVMAVQTMANPERTIAALQKGFQKGTKKRRS